MARLETKMLESLSDKLAALTPDDKLKFGVEFQACIIRGLLCEGVNEQLKALLPLLKPDVFEDPAAQIIMICMHDLYKQIGVIPHKEYLSDYVKKMLHSDDGLIVEAVNRIFNSGVNERILQHSIDEIKVWAKNRMMRRCYEPDVIQAVQDGDYEPFYTALSNAENLAVAPDDVSCSAIIKELINQEEKAKYTCGIDKLDASLSGGGPQRGQVLVWVGSTGAGKSMFLCNTAIKNVRRNIEARGNNYVLYLTMEMTAMETCRRLLANLSGMGINNVSPNAKGTKMETTLSTLASYIDKKIIVKSFSPNEISCNSIRSMIDGYKKKGKEIDIVVIDYLELINPNISDAKTPAWEAQKRIGTDMLGLAKSADVLVISATQTNRSGVSQAKKQDLSLESLSESFAKAMPLDYVIGINPMINVDEDTNTVQQFATLKIMKNRHGPLTESAIVELKFATARIVPVA